MKKIIGIGVTVIAGFAALADGYLLFFKGPSNTQASPVSSKAISTKAKSNSSSSSTADSSTAQQSPSSSQSSSMKDGTYTGASTGTEWGDVQLQIKVAGGKISKITVLAHPDTEDRSLMINQQALPVYKEEALAAQSATINQVSGATETYKGFTGSLQDAINQAQGVSL
ncbi:FMN-binding protein [Streptococcus parauberis]|uniref:FMN-binding protein n=2 Tax=Streptococcus parauberis TaxID=1348 RepID=A0AAE4HWZ3_9STRE|nr:FMN-binding protein [Streptococcus parauberis]MDT2731381.1 FMN-binding protein [Streptococcus parauberis]PIO78848.1 FMN-binding domain protein [Streptococcus parauberis]POS68057.1 FMN-binding domain protein [Streptococcus parauberis]